MDVVATEVKKLGGGLFIESTPGAGTRFTIRLPFTLAITQALIVRVGDELYALPVATVEGRRAPAARGSADAPRRGTADLRVRRPRCTASSTSARSSAAARRRCRRPTSSLPVILVRAGEHSTALVTDELVGSREIVVKSVGPADRHRSAASPAPRSSATAAS